jgi:hypothetical protein
VIEEEITGLHVIASKEMHSLCHTAPNQTAAYSGIPDSLKI